MTLEELKKAILNELLQQVSKAFAKEPDIQFLTEVASDIATQKELYEKATTDEEKEKIQTNLEHLKTQVMLRVETKKVQLARKGEKILEEGLRFVVSKFIPFV